MCDRQYLDQLAKDSHHQGIVLDIKEIPNVELSNNLLKMPKFLWP